MVLDMCKYADMVNELNINIIYSGPMWDDGIKGISEMVRAHLAVDDLPINATKSIFSVFVEQVTNMLMYSAGKERYLREDKEPVNVSTGMLVLGHKDKMYFIQTRNAVRNENVELIKGRIDHLNTLDNKELRKYHREQLNAENDNPESKGAGLGLIEIARRATAPIGYCFKPINDEISYFTMYVEVGQKEMGE